MHPTTIRAVPDDEFGPVRQLRAVIHPVAVLLAQQTSLRRRVLCAVHAVLREVVAPTADEALPILRLLTTVLCDGRIRILAGAINGPVVVAPACRARLCRLELGALRAGINVVQAGAGKARRWYALLGAVVDVVLAAAATAADPLGSAFLCA